MSFLDFIRTASLFLIPFLAVLIPILVGERYGLYRHKKAPVSKDFPIGTVVSVALGLYGFLLAFTFQIATNRFDARKQALFEDATNIRTTYLRAGLIPEPFRSTSRKLLVEYVDLRINLSADYEKLDEILLRSRQILDSLWKDTEALAAIDRSSEAYALYTTSVNELVDLYNRRVTLGLVYRIPVAILWALFIIEVLSMLVLGYLFGTSGKGSIRLHVLVATIFAVVMFLIFALDRPETGLTPLNQKPMIMLQQELRGKG